MKRSIKQYAVLGAVAGAFLLAGCAGDGGPKPEKAAKAKLAPGTYKGEVTNVDRMKGQKSPLVLNAADKSVTLTLPELNNNMGEGNAPTVCEATFKPVGLGFVEAGEHRMMVFQGSWPAANNNCALYVQRTSATFTSEASPRYLILEPKGNGYEVLMSWDSLGRQAILQGKLE